MRNLTKIGLSLLLILFVSGCEWQGKLEKPSKPKIDSTLESVDANSIKTISDITSVALEWKRAEDKRVNGYYIYRANMQDNGQKLKRVGTAENRFATHYLDTNLEPNTKYTYTISVKTHDGSESKTSQPIVALTKPILEPISFVQAISNLPRQIKILWRPHSSERVESYIIEKTTPSTSQWKLLKKLKGRLQVEYIDKNLKDSEVYVYRVKAVTYDKLISQPSQIVRAQTKALPKSIKNLKATQNLPRKIKITWEPSDTMDVVAYKVYRNDSEKGKYDFVTMISADTLSYDDLINDDGKAMFYKITAVDSDALETNLDTNSVMGRTLGQPAKPIIKLGLIQDNKAILNWEQGDKRTTSYIVYKTIKEGMFSSKVIKYENIQDLRFEDSDITRGVEYKYCVQAVDEFGLLSDKTDQILLTLPKLTSLK